MQDLMCISKQETFSPASSINSRVEQTKLSKPVKLPNRISSPSSCFSGTVSSFICEISSFVN